MASEAKLHSDSVRGREQFLSNKEVTMETKPQSTGVGNLGLMWGEGEGEGGGKKNTSAKADWTHSKSRTKAKQRHIVNFPLPPTSHRSFVCGFISKLYSKTGVIALAIQANARSLSNVSDDNRTHFDGVL